MHVALELAESVAGRNVIPANRGFRFGTSSRRLGDSRTCLSSRVTSYDSMRERASSLHAIQNYDLGPIGRGK